MNQQISNTMRAEDPWMLQAMLLGNEKPEHTIPVAEAESVLPEYAKSAAVHGFLVQAYMSLPAMLPTEELLSIEREKLRLAGKERLVPFLVDDGRSLRDIIRSIHPKPRPMFDFVAADDYIHLANVRAYLRLPNRQRADMRMSDAIKYSASTPAVFKHYIKPIASLYVVTKAIDPSTNNVTISNFGRLQRQWTQ